MRTCELGRMSWAEIDEVRNRPELVVLLPVGTVEQHGPHLPVNADGLVANFVSCKVAENTKSLVAPPLYYGCSTAHRNFPGTLSLRAESFKAILADVCGALAQTGFRRLVIVNNHGGNEPYVEEVARDLRRHQAMLVGGIYPWHLGFDLVRDVIPSPETTYGHGGEPETSAMMAMFPEDVQMERARPGGYSEFHGLRARAYTTVSVPGQPHGWAHLYLDANDVAPAGVTGDPMRARREYGEVWVRRMVEFGVSFVEAFRRLPLGV